MSQNVTIKDLAKALGISVATVSRALHDYDDISAKTKKAVLAMAEKMDYQPNLMARNLVMKKNNQIGVIIPGLIVHFYASAIGGMQDVLNEQGYNVLISQSNESFENEVNNVNTLLSNHISGLIISLSSQTSSFEHLTKLSNRGVPIVMINRVNDTLPFDRIMIDDYKGAYQAVNHLVEQGCRRIAHIGGTQTLSTSRQRLMGFKDALQDKNIELFGEMIHISNLGKCDGYKITKNLLNLHGQPPDGIFTVNDKTAIGAIEAIREKGLRIPDHIKIVSYGNDPLAELLDPPLTSVEQPTYALGKKAAELLIHRMQNNKNLLPPVTKMLEPKLIIRKSSIR